MTSAMKVSSKVVLDNRIQGKAMMRRGSPNLMYFGHFSKMRGLNRYFLLSRVRLERSVRDSRLKLWLL